MAAKKNPPADTPVPDPDQEPEIPPYATPVPAPGWWRNVTEAALDIVGVGVGVTVQPGEVVPLPWTPSHRGLAPATRADFEAQEKAAADAPAFATGGFVPGPDAAPPETPATPDPTLIQE